MTSQICSMFECERIATYMPEFPWANFVCDKHKPPNRDHTIDPYFGVCPVCGEQFMGMNIKRMNYFVCKKDRTFWLFGENMFSGWKWENELDWERAKYLIARSTEVAPAYLGWSDNRAVSQKQPPF